MEKIKKNKDVIIIGSILSVILLMTTLIKLKETRFAYYWDFVGYYEKSISIIDYFRESFELGIKLTIYTIFYSDYNYIPAILPAITMAILGCNRITYTIGVTLSYYIPFIFMFLIVIKPLFKNHEHKNLYMFISSITCMPLIMYLNYMGFVDIGGVTLILALLKITQKADYGIKNNIIIGTILMILFFFRRWYIFYIISYLITIFIFDLYNSLEPSKNNENFFRFLRKYLTIGLTMLLIVAVTIVLNVILFKDDSVLKLNWNIFYISKLLFVDYGQAYAGYNRPLTSDLIGIGNKFGYITIILVILSIIIAIKNKRNIKEVAFLNMQMIVCFVLFENTQSHDVHHYLLYLANIMLSIAYMISNNQKKKQKLIIILILLIHIIFSMPICYENGIVKSLRKYLVVNNLDLKALNREDIEELEKVNDEITRLSANGTKTIYINASSSIINSSMIYSYERTTGENFEKKSFLLPVSDVDSRDGVPETLKNADYVMVTDPAQVHLGEENQKIISYINKVFLDEQYSYILANKYKRLETMKIGKVNIYFYERIDNVTDEEYEIFIEKGKEYLK